ncbi:MAG: hypothetical protein ACODAD_14870, partial [Planctomycetota bacterium]
RSPRSSSPQRQDKRRNNMSANYPSAPLGGGQVGRGKQKGRVLREASDERERNIACLEFCFEPQSPCSRLACFVPRPRFLKPRGCPGGGK